MLPTQHTFCSHCGSRFAETNWPRACRTCGTFTYRNQVPAVVVLIPVIDRSRSAEPDGILIIRRGIKPCQGLWAMPGGFMEYDESWQHAGAREVEEEARVQLDEDALQLDSVRSDEDGVLIIFARSAPMPLASLKLDTFSPTSEVEAIDVMWRSNVRPLAFSLHDAVVAEFFEQRAPGDVRHG